MKNNRYANLIMNELQYKIFFFKNKLIIGILSRANP